MHRLFGVALALSLVAAFFRPVLAAEVADAPVSARPDIRPFMSAHFGLAGTVKFDGVTVDVLGEGDLAAPDRQQATFKFGPFTAEVIMVDQTVYTRTRFEPRWSRQFAGESIAIGPLSASEATRLGEDARLVGTETVNGVLTEHYTSSLDLSPLLEPVLPNVTDRDVREALHSLEGTIDIWVGASDRMVRQERLVLTIDLPAIEPNGDSTTGTIDLTLGYSKLNEPVTISAPSRNDTSPIVTPHPNVTQVTGPAGVPVLPGTRQAGATGPSGAVQAPAQAPVQAPAQIPRR
ncbi:MAG: hypothetical protein IT305_31695 [Chloroflexi bacterium]|nr:hypothetical protein [Chloroflexota bacterium]